MRHLQTAIDHFFTFLGRSKCVDVCMPSPQFTIPYNSLASLPVIGVNPKISVVRVLNGFCLGVCNLLLRSLRCTKSAVGSPLKELTEELRLQLDFEWLLCSEEGEGRE